MTRTNRPLGTVVCALEWNLDDPHPTTAVAPEFVARGGLVYSNVRLGRRESSRVALWKMEAVGDVVTLTYCESLLPGGKPPQKCGQTERVAEADLEAWVFDEAAPWDACEVTSGAVFVRQTTPAFGVRA